MRFLMKLLKKKCKSCSKRVNFRDLWSVEMNTADGKHTIKVCSDCAKVLEELKEALDGK